MSEAKGTKIVVSPWTAVLLAAFIALSTPVLLSALLLSAVCHELGHFLVLRGFGARVDAVCVSVFGAELRVADRPTLSYGREILAVVAGPAVNLLLAVILAWCGRWAEELYVFAGAQLVLAAFNLLPVRPLDGGTILWLLLAWWTDPFLADRGSRWIGGAVTAALLLLALWLWVKSGSPFLFLGAAGLSKPFWQEKKLVKKKRNR